MSDKGRRASERRREREKKARLDDVDDGSQPDDMTRAAPDGLTAMGEPIVDSALGHLDQVVTGDSLEGQPAEVTQPSVRPEKPMPPGGALVDLATGTRTPLAEAPFLVGRGTHCQLQFEQEPTISRAHLFMTYLEREGRWVIEDAGSTSGTLLNGKWLSAPTKLKHGDVIEIGTLTLRYRMDPTVPVPAPITEELTDGEDREPTAVDAKTALSRLSVSAKEAKKAKKARKAKKAKQAKADRGPRQIPWIPLAIAFALLVLVGGGSIAGYLIWRSGKDPEVLMAQKRELLDDIAALLKAVRLDEAKLRLDAVFALDPDDKEAASLLRIWESETAAKAALDRARELYAQGDTAAARAELDKIPKSSGFAQERERLLQKFESDLADQALGDIANLLDLGDLGAARKKLERLLKKDPTNKKAQALLARLEEIESRPPPKNPAIERAKKAFAVGNVKQARVVAAAEAARGTAKAKVYVDTVDAFSAAYTEGQRQVAKKNAAPAERSMAEAYRLAKVLSGKKGRTFQRKVGGVYADALYLAGMIDKSKGNGCGWGRRILKASVLAPGDAKIKTQRRKVDDKAQAALQRAKAKKASKPDEAKKIATDNKCYATPGSKVGRALSKLAR